MEPPETEERRSMDSRVLLETDLKQILHERKHYEALRTDKHPPSLRMEETKKGKHYRKVCYKDSAGEPCYDSKTIGGADSPEVQEIQANHFYKKAIEVLDQDEAAIRRFMKNYRPHDPASITEMLSPAYRPAACGLWLPEEEARARQQQAVEERKRAKEEREERARKRFGKYGIGDHKIRTVTGEMVRSRAEAIIYNALHAAGVPFVYEDTLWLKDRNGGLEAVSADFRIMIEPDVVWEHSGRFGTPEGHDNIHHKLDLYFHNGYTLGDNLIITMDDHEGSLNTQSLQQIVEMLVERAGR